MITVQGGFLDNLLSFCGNGNLLTEPEQPSLLDISLVALALFSELCPRVCYKLLFIFPLICVGQGEQHSDFTKVCNTL